MDSTVHPLMKETLAFFTGLTKLEVILIRDSYDALQEFLDALKKRKRDSTRYFPALKSIELEDIDFDEDLEDLADHNVYTLISSLKKREKIHPTISQFAIRSCINFTKRHWEDISCALPERVEKEWDGWEEIRDSLLDSDSDYSYY